MGLYLRTAFMCSRKWSPLRFAKIWPCQGVRPGIQFICYLIWHLFFRGQERVVWHKSSPGLVLSKRHVCRELEQTGCSWNTSIATEGCRLFQKEQLKAAARSAGVFIRSLSEVTNQTRNSAMYRFSWNRGYQMCWADSKISSWVQLFLLLYLGFCYWVKRAVWSFKGMKIRSSLCIHTRQIQSCCINLLTTVTVSFPGTSNSMARHPWPAGIEIRDLSTKVTQVTTGHNSCP